MKASVGPDDLAVTLRLSPEENAALVAAAADLGEAPEHLAAKLALAALREKLRPQRRTARLRPVKGPENGPERAA